MGLPRNATSAQFVNAHSVHARCETWISKQDSYILKLVINPRTSPMSVSSLIAVSPEALRPYFSFNLHWHRVMYNIDITQEVLHAISRFTPRWMFLEIFRLHGIYLLS